MKYFHKTVLLFFLTVSITACSSNKKIAEYDADNHKVGYSKKDGEYDPSTKNNNFYDPSSLLFGNEKVKVIEEESHRIRSGNSKQDDDEAL